MSRKSRRRIMAGRTKVRTNEDQRPGPALGDFHDRERHATPAAWHGYGLPDVLDVPPPLPSQHRDGDPPADYDG
jgi:hypothetical protein